MPAPFLIKTISEYHKMAGLAKPSHPLVSVLKFEDMRRQTGEFPKSISHGFYSVALKRNFNSKLKYGHQDLDFDEGVLICMAPNQILTFDPEDKSEFEHSGWLLLIHPDFLWSSHLSKKVKQYDYFGYNNYEALHLSSKEEAVIVGILKQIAEEYEANTDKFSQEVVISQIDLLLTYCDRFYQRQFMTRTKSNHHILDKFEELLTTYFSSDNLEISGIPGVQYFADALHLSPDYLGRLLKTITGQSTKNFIQDKLIDLAKEKLSSTSMTVSEISYQLGFQHPQSFSKIFKLRTTVSPIAFRRSLS